MMAKKIISPTVLVTGSTGFIGCALVKRLAIENFPIIATMRNHINLPFDKKVNVINSGNLTHTHEWQKILESVNVVVHLASRVHAMKDRSKDQLAEYRNVNVVASINLARQAAQAGVRRFIYLSTIKVNGEFTRPGCPFTADDLPMPKGPYAISKYEAELGLRKIALETGMEVVIIRPPLVYGPGVKANFLNMMHWLSKSIPMPFGAINNRRSLVALDNLVDLIVTCINHPSAADEVFLVSDGEDLSTKDLMYRMGNALGKPVRLISVPVSLLYFFATLLGHHTVVERLCSSLQVDISKTCMLLKWSPVVGVDEGLRSAAQGFRTK